MVEEKIPKRTVNYKGVFEFSEIYKLVHDRLNDMSYTSADYKGVGPKDLYELEYIEKGESPIQYLIRWKSLKKSQEFFTFKIDVLFQGKDISKTEIMHEGKKVKVDSGEITIEIDAAFVDDSDEEAKKHPFLKHFSEKFKKMTKDVKKTEKEAFAGDVDGLHDVVKRYFGMKGKYMPAEVAPVRKG